MEDLILPEPIGLQSEWLESPKSRKVCRIGRRGSKTRFALIAAVAGHGPGEDGARKFPGIAEGVDVVWVAQDYPNLIRVVWQEEIIPRMGHLSWCTLHKSAPYTAAINGKGTLHLVSAEAINGIRGLGKKVGGVIIDEAAWLDLEAALQDVILAILLDNGGWLIIMSTTNAGPDGNTLKRLPSYFNVICTQVRAGERSDEWVEFYGTAFENPVISDQAIRELIAEYPPDSPKLKQEVYAELLVAGVGLALSELDAAIHIVPRYTLPSHWTQFGGFDWGFNHPWCFGWYAADEDGNIVKIESISGRESQKEQIHDTVSKIVPLKHLRTIIAGHDIFFRKGRAIGFQGPTIAEYLITQGWRLQQADARPGSRAKGLDNFRNYIHHTHEQPPRFTLLDTEGNRACLTQLQSMQLDPKDLEDALKIDADSSGKGGDDYYDETRMALSSRPCKARVPGGDIRDHKQLDRAIPIKVKDGKFVKPERPPKTIEEMVEWAARRQRGSDRTPLIQRTPTRR